MAAKTVIFGHCNHVYAKVGQKVKKGDKIYELGSTGYSSGPHVHITAVDGEIKRAFYTDDYSSGSVTPLKDETESFLSDDMFTFGGAKRKPYITYGFDHPRSHGAHRGIDVVSDDSYLDRLPDAYWTKDTIGTVVAVGDDRSETSYGYGKFLVIVYDDGTTPKDGKYLVKSGDTLGKIAAAHGTTYQELAKINGLANPNLIYPGQELKLSGAGAAYYTVVSGDSLGVIALRYGMSLGDLLALNSQIKNPDLIHPGDKIRVA